MEFITIQEVEQMAKPGDKLQGILYQYPDGLPKNKVRVNEITFWDCIGCLTGKPDVIDGADYYLQKQEDGSFKKYGIKRIVNNCMKVPKEFVEHLIFKHIYRSSKWEEQELVNCYYEEEPTEVNIPRYCCCYNVAGSTRIEKFNTINAVWCYFNTVITAGDAHTLDKMDSKKEFYIKILKDEIKHKRSASNEKYQKEMKEHVG